MTIKNIVAIHNELARMHFRNISFGNEKRVYDPVLKKTMHGFRDIIAQYNRKRQGIK